METKQQLLQVLERARAVEQGFVGELTAEERSASGTFERWSAKDLIAHVAAWKERRAQAIRASLRGNPPPPDNDLEKINRGIFEAKWDCPWADVLAYLDLAHRSLTECMKVLADNDLTTTRGHPWQEGRSLSWCIAYYGYLHSVWHMTQYWAERGKVDFAVRLCEEAACLVAQLFEGDPAWRGTVQYNLACYYALSNQQEEAISALGRALRLNPSLVAWSKEDPDLSSIRDYPGYRSLYCGRD